MPDEPLIFVEVALMDRIPDAVQPLLDLKVTSSDGSTVDLSSPGQPPPVHTATGEPLFERTKNLLCMIVPRMRGLTRCAIPAALIASRFLAPGFVEPGMAS